MNTTVTFSVAVGVLIIATALAYPNAMMVVTLIYGFAILLMTWLQIHLNKSSESDAIKFIAAAPRWISIFIVSAFITFFVGKYIDTDRKNALKLAEFELMKKYPNLYCRVKPEARSPEALVPHTK